MFEDIINSLIKIFNQDAYLNLTVSYYLTLRKDTYTPHDAKLYTKITCGVVENKILIDYLLAPFIKGKRVKPLMRNILRVGVYTISFLKLPNHYVVNELVQFTKQNDYKASTFVNAILRNYIRTNIENLGLEKALEEIERKPFLEKLSLKYSINLELVALLNQQYSDVETILKTSEEKYNYYRINTLKTSVNDVVKILKQEQIIFDVNDTLGVIKTSVSLINHQLFSQGLIVAQDLSSIKVGVMADPKENILVLDACAAPGSKAMHLASLMNNTGHIDACDIHEHKLTLIEENIQKLGVTNTSILLADATSHHYDKNYDLIIIDAPCSGLGVMNHKSDLKYRMTLDRIKEINLLQKRIIEHLSCYLKVGGSLVYSTCTINKEENEWLVEKFLRLHPEFQKIQEEIIIPNQFEHEDGFYICKLRKEELC